MSCGLQADANDDGLLSLAELKGALLDKGMDELDCEDLCAAAHRTARCSYLVGIAATDC